MVRWGREQVFYIRIAWRLRPYAEKLIFHKWRNAIPKAWQQAAADLGLAYTILGVVLGLMFFSHTKSFAVATLAVLLATGIFSFCFLWLLKALALPRQTGTGSRELSLLARRFRRGSHKLGQSPEKIIGVTKKQAGGIRIIDWFLRGEFGLHFLREIAFRVDLLVLSSRLFTLLATLAVCFGTIYWGAVDSLGAREALLYSFGILSTVELVAIERTATVQNWAALQICIQLFVLVLTLPLILSLHERDLEKNEAALGVARKLSAELRDVFRQNGFDEGSSRNT